MKVKAAAKTVEKASAVDVMEARRASVERARNPKDTGDKADSPVPGLRAGTRRRPRSSGRAPAQRAKAGS
ncbi:hypothetical protein Slala03_54010 [Streptomyces lavendulae subsp. lavendulae]|nr:hypothetical protein Slala03_54010 [Streptomyces lavendulae subsp. lavendulae]